jgi:hypothetical protein
LRALRRFVDATDDSPMVVLIVSFSSSRLNGLDFLSPFLSFLDFLGTPAEGEKKDCEEFGVLLELAWLNDSCLE